MKFHQKSLFLFFLILPSWPISAQDYDDFIEGVLLDSKSREPIVFATIRIKGKALGVISNQDGGFRIPLEFQEKGEELEISSMGYNTYTVLFDALETNGLNRILLQPALFQLQETIVTATKKRLTSKEIIQKALNRIPDNYENNPFELIGYYRDYQIKNKKYSNLNEAIIKVFDGGFENDDYLNTEYGIYAYSKNYDFEIDSFAAKPYNYRIRDKFIPDAVFNNSIVPNELVQLFNHDALRNNNERTYSYVNTFVKDFIKEHDFFTYFLTNYGDKKVYKIKFNKSTVPFQVKGDIYIDKDTYAIRKLDYTVYRQKIDEASSTNYSDSEMDLLYEILVEYQNHKEYMYLNYISFHNQFELIRPPEFFIEDVIFDPNTYQMTMVLNKPAVNWLKMNVKDFKVYYDGNRLGVDKVVRVGSIGNTYSLSFSRKGKRQRERLDFLFSKIEDIDKSSLVIVVNKMVDADGNLVGERKSEMLDQFREFFTQKIIPVKNIEENSSFLVDKSASLGRQEQTIIQTKMDGEYWMNTPLKKVKQ